MIRHARREVSGLSATAVVAIASSSATLVSPFPCDRPLEPVDAEVGDLLGRRIRPGSWESRCTLPIEATFDQQPDGVRQRSSLLEGEPLHAIVQRCRQPDVRVLRRCGHSDNTD
jgi:hypothetical protein